MTTEIAVLEGGAQRGAVRREVDLIAVAQQAEAAKALGATLIESGLLPNAVDKPEKAMAIMLTGQELGVPAMFALKNITVIQGTPAPSEQLMGLLIRRAGHKLRVVESTNERCTVEGVRADDPRHRQRVTFTIEDAKRAGLLSKNSWRNYPRAMLRARAKSELGRSMFEDALAGLVYLAEELGAEVDAEGEIVDAPFEPPEEGSSRATPRQVGATPRQVGYLKGLMKQAGVNRERIEEREGPVEEWTAQRVSNAIELLKERIEAKAKQNVARDSEAGRGEPEHEGEDLPQEERPRGYVTDEQVERLQALAEELYGDTYTGLSGREIVERNQGCSVHALTASEAEDLILEMEGMLKARGGTPAGAAR